MTIDARVELYHSGQWNDITPDVAMEAGDITVKYGQPDEHSESVPTSVGLVLDNRDRSYSPKDPMSPLFGLIDRNTPMRVRIGDPQPALALPGVNGSYVSTPDAATLDITGDIDLRVDLTPETWHPATAEALAAKYSIGGDQRSWVLQLQNNGTLIFRWSTAGTFATLLSATSTAVVYDENLFPNPSGGLGVGDWITNKTLTRVTGLLLDGFPRDTGGRITGDGSGEDFIVLAPGAAVAGLIYSGAISLEVSADATVEVYLLFLNSGLSVVGSPSTGQIAVSAGEVVRLAVEGQTAPANTAHITMQVSVVNSTADLTVSAGRVKRGSTADDYGDGADVGWEWSGTEHTSTSRHVRGVRRAVRVTLDVDNGAAGRTTTFYTADSIAGPWTQLGSVVTTAGTTSIFSSTAALEVGSGSGGGGVFTDSVPLSGLVHAAEVRNGIAGTVVADPDFTAQDVDTTGFTDAAGRVWTINGDGYVTDRSLRASVAVSSWTPSWDETTLDALTVVDASGILRRLGIGSQAVQSAIRTGILTKTSSTLVAYWPCEDGETSTSIAAGIPGVAPMHIAVGAPDFAANTDFACSDPLPTPGASYWVGTVPTYSSTEHQVRWLLSIPDAGISEQSVIAIYTSGTIATWLVVVNSGGSLSLRAFNRSGTSVFDSGFTAFDMNGNPRLVSVEFSQDGADVDCNLVTLAPGAPSGGQLGVQTISSQTIGRVTGVQQGSIGDCGAGHFSVHSQIDSIFTLGNQLAAWDGELAGDRIARLCAEEGVHLLSVGDFDTTTAMGVQQSDTLVEHLDKCRQADLGLLGEQLDRLGLRYLARNGRYNRLPVLELDMREGTVTNPFAPPLDDQDVRNDVTVSREGGSSARAVQETGPVNVNDPADDPQGVGRHTSTPRLNVQSDDQLPDQAGFRLHLGTVDGHRVAALEVEMEHHTDLIGTVLGLLQGDVIRVKNPPPGLPPGPLDLVVLGWSDKIGTQKWRVVFTLAPASPWSVINTGDGVSKLNSGTSTLNTGVDDDDTSLSVAIASGRLWTTDAAEMPIEIEIGGEDMTVTAISGSSSPQTFTVVRAMNGVVKSHSSGARVALSRRATLAL